MPIVNYDLSTINCIVEKPNYTINVITYRMRNVDGVLQRFDGEGYPIHTEINRTDDLTTMLIDEQLISESNQRLITQWFEEHPEVIIK